MSNKLYLIHGFNVKDNGAATTGAIKELLEAKGFDVTEITYGFFHRLRVRLCNKGIASTIASLVEPGSTCVAHSNGAAITYLACELGAPFKNVTFINPALDKNKALASQVEHVQIWYSPHDKWTGLSKFIPNSVWGAQGRVGYKGPYDYRYEQYDQEELLGRFPDEHSGLFSSLSAKELFVSKQVLIEE